MKLYDSELKIMEILWKKGDKTAKELSLIATDDYDWNKNTTYTVIKKLVDKGAIKRKDPGFICSTLVNKEEVQYSELNSMIDKLWNGSKKAFFSAFAKDANLSSPEVKKLLDKIEEE